MKCINRILEPVQGSVVFDGADILSMGRRDVAKLIGYVPQNSESSISMPTVFEVVLMGRAPHNVWKDSKEDEEVVWRALERLNVAKLANQGFDELSSGQVQRVLIARALVQETKLLLLDEPTSNLDIRYQMEVMDIIRRVTEENSIGACAIIHDLNLAMRFCDRIVLMKDGDIVSFGPTEEVLTAESIRDVFGIDTEILHHGDRNYVLVLRRLS